MMQATILVPLDGSAQGEDALPAAMLLAERLRARLHLVHVHESIQLVYASDLSLGEIPTANTAIDDQCRDDEQTYLDRLAAQLRAAGFAVSTELLSGLPDDAIGHAASGAGASLIVMSSHARVGLGRIVLGSLADDLIRHGDTPVLLTRVQPAEIPALPLPPIRHILIALDGSPLAEHILPITDLVAGACDAELTLLSVTGFHSPGSQRSAIHQYLTGLANRYPHPERVHTVMVADPDPAAAILEYAHTRNVDVIALATHGRGGLSRLLFGSVADRVVHGADRPVLVYRPEEAV